MSAESTCTSPLDNECYSDNVRYRKEDDSLMSAVTRLRRSERRALIKDELADAAAVVIARKGYQAASVAEIAAEAGYTVGAVYSNFSGKRALFEAVFDRQVEQQFAIASVLDQPGGDLGELARALLDQDENGRRWWLLWLEFVIEAQRDPANAFPLRDTEARARASIADILREWLPGLSEDLTLATALQSLWRGWLLGAAAHSQADSEGFARSIEWLVVGATTCERSGVRPKAQRLP
jgi:AcrR family transcriptional regulator